MFRLGQRGQMTVYVENDSIEPLLTFAADHPIASASDIANAALRFYLPYALKGVDGRLRPLHLTHANEPYSEQLKSLVDDLTKVINTQRRVVWTEDQRERARQQIVDDIGQADSQNRTP